MKKKVVVLFTICFMFAFVQQYFKQSSELVDFFFSTLVFVESHAQDETGPNSWLQPDDVRCHYKTEDGWVHVTTETICVFCAVPYSCTPVGCGSGS